MARTTIVELAGIPGAGKSTLGVSLGAALAERGLDALSRAEAWRRALARSAGRMGGAPLVAGVVAARETAAFALQHPALLARVLAAQRAHPAADWGFGLQRFFRDVVHHRVFRRRLQANEAVVFGEGFVQRAVNVCVPSFQHPRTPSVRAYAAAVPCPDAVVLVRAPVRLCAERLLTRRRGVPRRLRTAAIDLEQFLGRAADALELTCRALAARGLVVIEVDNAGSLDGAADRLNAAVDELITT